MNVFRKISSVNIFATEKKKTSVNPPQSAQKIDLKKQHCYFLFDYEIRADGLLVCRISKEKNFMNSVGSNKLIFDVSNCLVKEKIEMKNLWVGKEYCFVNLASLVKEQNENDDENLGGVDFVADRIFVIYQDKKHSKH